MSPLFNLASSSPSPLPANTRTSSALISTFCVTIVFEPGRSHCLVGIFSNTGIENIKWEFLFSFPILLYAFLVSCPSDLDAETFVIYWCQYKSPSLLSTSNFCKYNVFWPYPMYSFFTNSAPPIIAFSGSVHPSFLAFSKAFVIIADVLPPVAPIL